MMEKQVYEYAKQRFAEYGIDTDQAIGELKNIPVALHCWQGDDVTEVIFL